MLIQLLASLGSTALMIVFIHFILVRPMTRSIKQVAGHLADIKETLAGSYGMKPHSLNGDSKSSLTK